MNKRKENCKNYSTMFCKCGCGDGVILKVEKDGVGASLQLVSSRFSSQQENSLIEKLKRIWCIIKNKEYRYFDILIDENELKEFKDFVAQI